MSYLAGIRQKQRSRGMRALGLFAAVWLNMALQPCAMASQAKDNHDCPHCPPAVTHEHGDTHAGMEANMPCADGARDCAVDQVRNHDGRGGQLKLKDALADLAVAITADAFARPFHRPRATAPGPRYSKVHAGASPPLHVLNCVYLD